MGWHRSNSEHRSTYICTYIDVNDVRVYVHVCMYVCIRIHIQYVHKCIHMYIRPVYVLVCVTFPFTMTFTEPFNMMYQEVPTSPCLNTASDKASQM